MFFPSLLKLAMDFFKHSGSPNQAQDGQHSRSVFWTSFNFMTSCNGKALADGWASHLARVISQEGL